MRKLLFTLLILCSLCVNAQYQTTKISGSTQAVADGINYFLPQNILKVDLTIVETRSYIGPYAEFANKLLGIDNIIKSNKVDYEIDNVDIEIGAMADTKECYHVSIDEKSKEQGALKFFMSDDGVIKAFGYDVIPENLIPEYKEIQKVFEIDNVNHAEISFIDIFEEKDDDDSTGNTKSLTKEEKANIAMEKIKEIRNAYFELVSGFHEVDFGSNSLAYMSESLKNIENEYLSLFKGKKLRYKYIKTFYVIPEATHKNGSVTIAKISDNEGVVNSNSKNGTPIKLQFETASISLNEVLNPDGVTVYTNKLVYRIPGISTVKVMCGNDIVMEKVLKISQFGSYNTVPANNYKIAFDPNTGQVISMTR